MSGLGVALPAGAVSICRWVDGSGRTQVSDVVPEQYRKSATCTDSKKYDLPTAAVQRAQARAAEEKLAADNAGRRSQPASVPPAAKPSSVPSAAKRPAQKFTKDTDCETWRRLYDESVLCFGPFRTTRGATKPEAFEKCSPIPSPMTRAAHA